MTDPYNIGVEILVLSSVALISNIGLLIAEAVTDEPNEKYTTFNKEPSFDNDKFTALDFILILNGARAFNNNGG